MPSTRPALALRPSASLALSAGIQCMVGEVGGERSSVAECARCLQGACA